MKEIKEFREWLRKAFSSTSMMMEDLNKAFEYERTGDLTEVYFKKIEKFIKNIISYKFNVEELTINFLLHCAKYEELEEEVKMRDLEKSKDLKTVIKNSIKWEQRQTM